MVYHIFDTPFLFRTKQYTEKYPCGYFLFLLQLSTGYYFRVLLMGGDYLLLFFL